MTILDPVAFIRDVLRDPETGEPFVLYPRERRLRAFCRRPLRGSGMPSCS